MAYPLLTDIFDGYLQYGIPVDRVLSIAQAVTNNTYTALLREWYVNGKPPRQAVIGWGKSPVLAYVTNRNYSARLTEALEFIASNPIEQMPLRLISHSHSAFSKLDAAGVRTIEDYLGCTRWYLRSYLGFSNYVLRNINSYLRLLGVTATQLLSHSNAMLVRDEQFWMVQDYVVRTGVSVDDLYRLAGDSITSHVAELTKPIFAGDSQRSTALGNGLSAAAVSYYCASACTALCTVAIPLHMNGGKYSRSMPVAVLGPAAPYVESIGCKTVGDVVDLPAGRLTQLPGFGPVKYTRLQCKLKEVTE